LKKGSQMGALKSICVYCSASVKVEDHYKIVARGMGNLIAKAGLRLVYGGARIGMMGAVSDGVIESKGTVLGVTTKYLGEHEGIHDGLQTLRVVDDMHARKHMMFEEADAFVVLPGGFGTLDEFFEVLTWKQIGLHAKPMVVLNYEKFWDPLKVILCGLEGEGFISKKDTQLCHFVESVEEVIPLIRTTPVVKVDPAEKWGNPTGKPVNAI